jgi:type IV pilus assembly protein PilQ
MPKPLPAGRGLTAGVILPLIVFTGVATVRGQQEGTLETPIPGAEPEVVVNERGTVEMHVSELPLSTVLQLLSIESRRNIIASPAVSGTVTASLYDVSFEDALDAVLASNGAGYHSAGRFIFVHTNEELAQMALAANPPITRVFRLSYVSATDVEAYLTPLLGEDGSITVSPAPEIGIGSDAEVGGGNSTASQDFIVVTARPANMERITDVLRQIDVKPKQVLIEATILRATLNDTNELGIDFSLVGGVDLEMLGASSLGLADLTLGDLPQDRFEQFNARASTDFSDNLSPGGLSIGIIKDNVAVFIHALESVTDTTVLANPKVLALNKQRGQVIVGRRDGYLTTTVTETQAIQTVEFLETGTQLIFRPFIGDDGFVRVELHPEDSVGVVNAQGLPNEQTTEVTTNVLVRDGHTILIGGLFREVVNTGRAQIPLLGSIPGIGTLFGSDVDSTTREEVIILMTVHVVKDHQRYAEMSDKQRENLERMRVGLRQGLMWHGRERLAQRHYQKALKHFADGDKDKALWNVNLALHNSPRFLPAIELKERIVNQRDWHEDGAPVRGFLQRLLAEERGTAFAPYGRPLVPPPDDRARSPADDPSGDPGEAADAEN